MAEPDSLDPAWPTELVSQGAILTLYEPLFAFRGDEGGALAPLIAAKVPARGNGLISADGLTYTIPIRSGAAFHDGRALTADDARYSILRFMLSDREGGPSSELLRPLLGVSSTRDEQGHIRPGLFEQASRAVQVRGGAVVLNLRAPFAPLLAVLATRAPVVSRAWAAANGDWDGTEAAWTRFNNPRKEDSPFFNRANGTGPFRLARWDRQAKELILERNERYWGRPARLKRVVLKCVPEFGTRRLALEAGDADAISADIGSYSQLQGLAGVKVMDDLPRASIEPVAYFNFAINPEANPNIGSGRLDGDGIPSNFFADKDVRKAFAQAFDYAGFIRDLYRGKAVQATGFVPRGMLGHNPAQPVYGYDLAAARRRFQEAWGGRVWEKGFRLVLVYNAGNNSRQTLCQMLKRAIEGLNPRFHVEIRAMEWPSYLDAAHARRLPIMIFNLSADYPDPHSFAFEVMHSQGNDPVAQGYKNPQADRLVEAALAETSPAKRRQLYFRLQEIEHADVPHLLFVESAAFRVARAWAKGLRYNAWSLYPRWDEAYKQGD